MIDWPSHLDRTDAHDRRSDGKFEVTLAKALTKLETQLDRLGVDDDDYRFEHDAPTRKKDGRPYKRADPDDPGFVLRWRIDGVDYAAGCDSYDTLRGNVRALGLWFEEKRKMEGRPVATAESEFANAALPPGNEDREAVVAREPPHEVLGVSKDADPAVVKGAARQLQAKYHPDSGDEPDEEQFKRVVDAREVMTDGQQ